MTKLTLPQPPPHMRAFAAAIIIDVAFVVVAVVVVVVVVVFTHPLAGIDEHFHDQFQTLTGKPEHHVHDEILILQRTPKPSE